MLTDSNPTSRAHASASLACSGLLSAEEMGERVVETFRREFDAVRGDGANLRSVAIVDAGSGHVLLDLKRHATIVWDVAMHPDGTQFATVAGGYASEGCELRLWGRLPGMDWPPRLLRE